MAIMSSRPSSVQPEPRHYTTVVDRGGRVIRTDRPNADCPHTFVSAVVLALDCWVAARRARCDAIDRAMLPYSPELARLHEPVPADDDLDHLDVLAADLEAEAVRGREEWWHDLGADAVADCYGDCPEDHRAYDLDSTPFDLQTTFDDDDVAREAWESESVLAYLRRREAEGAADELARWGGHPG